MLLAGYVVFDFFVGITGYWIASKLFATPEKSTFVNALKLWGSYVILLILWAIGFVILFVSAAVVFRQHASVALVLYLLGILFLLAMLIVVPMNLYQIGFFRAFAFICLCVVFRFVSAFAVQQMVVNMPDVPWLPHSTQALAKELIGNPKHLMDRIAGTNAPDQIDWMLDEALVPIGPTPSLRERQAMVAVLQQKLQERKATFPPGVPPPPAFQDQMNRYTKFLNEVKADMAQPRPQGTASTSS